MLTILGDKMNCTTGSRQQLTKLWTSGIKKPVKVYYF